MEVPSDRRFPKPCPKGPAHVVVYRPNRPPAKPRLYCRACGYVAVGPVPPRLTREEKLRRFIEAHGGRCYYCGVRVDLKTATRDHRVPRSKGGRGDPGNIVLACAPCNRKKGDRDEEEFAASSDLHARRVGVLRAELASIRR